MRELERTREREREREREKGRERKSGSGERKRDEFTDNRQADGRTDRQANTASEEYAYDKQFVC